jgi:hypothetical protein
MVAVALAYSIKIVVVPDLHGEVVIKGALV